MHTDTVNKVKKLRLDVGHGSSGTTPTITLLNEHSNKVTPDNILLHPYISALFNLQQRRFFL